jgi:hypothetical protein
MRAVEKFFPRRGGAPFEPALDLTAREEPRRLVRNALVRTRTLSQAANGKARWLAVNQGIVWQKS